MHPSAVLRTDDRETAYRAFVADLRATAAAWRECRSSDGAAGADRPSFRRCRVRIAQIAPPWLPVPPPGYGGIENVVALLTDGLVARGHDVTLFACGGSATTAHLDAHEPGPLGTTAQLKSPLAALTHVVAAFARSAEFDVVHDHTVPFGPALAVGRGHVLHTVHVPPSAPHVAPVYDLVNGRLPLVAVSDAQRAECPHLLFTATIHNGVDLAELTPAAAKDDYLLFLGRMSAGKGVHVAARTARRLGRRLVIAAKMQNPDEVGYFEAEVRPLLSADVMFIGEAGRHERVDLLARAAGTLVPSLRNEPFGLVVVESLACGTPVVALRAGAAPELVEHGVTGFVADDVDAFAQLAGRVDEIDPLACRRAAEERFGADRMVAAYELLYADLAV